MTETEYNKMLAECQRIGIGKAEWIQQKIATSRNHEEIIRKSISKLQAIRRRLSIDGDNDAHNLVVELIHYLMFDIQ